MNRFESTHFIIRILRVFSLPILAFCLLLALFLNGISSVSETTVNKQMESLETALNRSIAQSYAVDGIYPPSLAYIEEHYGLYYNHDLFFIDYQPIGSNLLPDVTIIRK